MTICVYVHVHVNSGAQESKDTGYLGADRTWNGNFGRTGVALNY